MISVLDTSDYSILWTVPNKPCDIFSAWVPRYLSANVGDVQWLSGIQPTISHGVMKLMTFSCNIGCMEGLTAMVQINTPNPNELKAYPEQRTILRMRCFKNPSNNPDFHCLNTQGWSLSSSVPPCQWTDNCSKFKLCRGAAAGIPQSGSPSHLLLQVR